MDLLSGGYGGSIPANYDRYLRPFLFEPFADDLVRRLRVRSGLRILEVACGTGVVTARLREALPADSELVATDLGAGMIEYARALLGSDRIVWQRADAAALPFPDGSFDAVLCQFGWMFFPDKTHCAREARRVLKRGGQLLFNVWLSFERNEPAGILQRAVDGLLGERAPTFLKTPYGYGDPKAIAQWLAAAGFVGVRIDEVELESESPAAKDIANGLLLGTPVFNELDSKDPELVPAVREAVTRALVERYGSGRVAAKLTAYVAEATAP